MNHTYVCICCADGVAIPCGFNHLPSLHLMGARVRQNPYMRTEHTRTARATYTNLHVEYVPAVSFCSFIGDNRPSPCWRSGRHERQRLHAMYTSPLLCSDLGGLAKFVQMTTKGPMINFRSWSALTATDWYSTCIWLSASLISMYCVTRRRAHSPPLT